MPIILTAETKKFSTAAYFQGGLYTKIEVVQQSMCEMTNCSSLTPSGVQGHGDSVGDNHIGCRL